LHSPFGCITLQSWVNLAISSPVPIYDRELLPDCNSSQAKAISAPVSAKRLAMPQTALKQCAHA